MSGSNEADPSSAQEAKDEAEDVEDLSNLQRAWEMLEMSKVRPLLRNVQRQKWLRKRWLLVPGKWYRRGG